MLALEKAFSRPDIFNTIFARAQAALFDKNLPSKIGVRLMHGILCFFDD
jgi:hypothetical protein